MEKLTNYAKYLLLLVITLHFTSCEPEEGGSENPETESASFTGVWVRVIGASGDETNLAIGLIPGEPNRVFMCEKIGSTAAGFYKGNLSGNTIVWDGVYGLPNTKLRMVGGQLEFHYSTVEGSLPTRYDPGSWAAECGTLSSSNTGETGNTGGNTGENPSTGKASFWVQSDLGCGNITVVLNGVSGTISQYHTSNPGCNGSGTASFELPAGTYNFSASCSEYTWNGSVTVTNGQCYPMQLTI